MAPIQSLQNLCVSNILKQGNSKIQQEFIKIRNFKEKSLEIKSEVSQYDEQKVNYMGKLEEITLVILTEIKQQNALANMEENTHYKQGFLKVLNIVLSLKNWNLEKQIACFKCSKDEKDRFESEKGEYALLQKNLSDCMEALRQITYACYILKNEKAILLAKNEELHQIIFELNNEISQHKLANIDNEANHVGIILPSSQKELKSIKTELEEFQKKTTESKSQDQTCTRCDCLEMKNELKNLEDENNHIYKLYKTLLETNKKLTEELISLKNECEYLSLENQSLAKIIKNIEQEVEQSELNIKSFENIVTNSQKNEILTEREIENMENESELFNYSVEDISDTESDYEYIDFNEIQELKNKLKEDVEAAEKLNKDCDKLKEESFQLSKVIVDNCNLENILQTQMEEINYHKEHISNLEFVNNVLQKKYDWAHNFCENLVQECAIINSKKAKYKQGCKTFQNFAKVIESDIKAWSTEKKDLLQKVKNYRKKIQMHAPALNIKN